MSRSVAELPKVAGTCPEPLTAAIRRAVRSGGSWQETADRVVGAFGGRVPGPGLLSAAKLAGDPSGYQTHLVHAEPDGSFSIVVMVWLPGQQTPDPRPSDLVLHGGPAGNRVRGGLRAPRRPPRGGRAQRQPGRHRQRLRPARRHPPGHQHRRLRGRLDARLRHRHHPRRLKRPPRLRAPGPLALPRALRPSTAPAGSRPGPLSARLARARRDNSKPRALPAIVGEPAAQSRRRHPSGCASPR